MQLKQSLTPATHSSCPSGWLTLVLPAGFYTEHLHSSNLESLKTLVWLWVPLIVPIIIIIIIIIIISIIIIIIFIIIVTIFLFVI